MTARTEQIEQLDLAHVRPDPNNPRKMFGPIDELVDSIKKHGVMQPIVVRPKGDGFMVVFGERRYRASVKAGLKQIPAIVRDYDDQETLERQIVENIQREDIHPMEEAEAFGRLRDEFEYNVDQISARVGKSRSSIFATMKLLDLTEPSRKAFYSGKLTSSTAQLIARFQGENAQSRALAAITKTDKRGEPMSFRQAQEYLQRYFGKDRAAKDSRVSGSPAKLEKKAAREAEQRVRVRTAATVIAKAVRAVEHKRDLDTPELRMILLALIQQRVPVAVMERRGLETEEALRAAISKKLPPAELRGLLFEIAITPWAGDNRAEFSDQLRAIAKAFGLDLRQLEREEADAEQQQQHHETAEGLFRKVAK